MHMRVTKLYKFRKYSGTFILEENSLKNIVGGPNQIFSYEINTEKLLIGPPPMLTYVFDCIKKFCVNTVKYKNLLHNT